MKTKKPLRQLIPEIKLAFERFQSQLQFDYELYQMHEGQIKKKVEESLALEIISTSAYKRAIQRIPSINIPRKVTDKLSKVYAEAPNRFAKKDKQLVEDFADLLHLNAVFNHANKMANLNKRCAIEIYQSEGKQKARVLNAHQFFVFSDSPTEPNKPTVFCKLLGREKEINVVEQTVSRDGTKETTQEEVTLVDILAIYSEDEILIIDSGGRVREDKMKEMGIKSDRNPFGTIPFVYVNKSMTELMPYPNQTAYDMAILVPKLLTDLNYSAQFLSHSLIYTINADIEGAEINPDGVVNLGDGNAQEGMPEIGTIDPKTDIDGILKMIEFEMGMYLTTEGMKTGSIGQLEAGSASSGISKIIDESDATETRKAQTELFRWVESKFWKKFSTMQDVWSKNNIVEKKDTFAADFMDSFSVKFAEIKPLESEKEKYDKIKVARDLKLITKKQALKELYPNLPEDQLDKRLEELEEELKKEKDEMMSMGLTPGATQLDRQQKGVSDEKLAQKEANGSEPE